MRALNETSLNHDLTSLPGRRLQVRAELDSSDRAPGTCRLAIVNATARLLNQQLNLLLSTAMGFKLKPIDSGTRPYVNALLKGLSAFVDRRLNGFH